MIERRVVAIDVGIY